MPRGERALVAACLAAMALLAWVYLWQGAGMGRPALAMTRLALFPHLEAAPAGAMPFSWPVVAGMWWAMMIAMMVPSAAPLALLFERVLRHHAKPGDWIATPVLALVSGYFVAWLAFSLVAAALEAALRPGGLIAAEMLWSQSALFSAAVLAAAGVYQLTPFKHACLAQCRSPVNFLTRHWRPGHGGAFYLGVRHGAYCVGCCWMLMALLFVGGVMNLVWIAALAFLVLVERVAPAGAFVGKLTGVLLIVWAAATLWV